MVYFNVKVANDYLFSLTSNTVVRKSGVRTGLFIRSVVNQLLASKNDRLALKSSPYHRRNCFLVRHARCPDFWWLVDGLAAGILP